MPVNISKLQPLLVLVGPTAIGKTDLSFSIAEAFDCEIISMDSMQIYKYMDIGTAKPTPAERQRVPHHLIDFVDPASHYDVSCYVRDAGRAIDQVAARGRLPLLVGGTGLYLKGLLEGLFTLPPIPRGIREEIRELLRRKGHDFLHGELSKVDPESAARIHPHDSQRLTRAMEIFAATGKGWSAHLRRQQEEKAKRSGKYMAVKIGLSRPREELYERINQRVGLMVEAGLQAEVEGLLARGYSRNLQAMQSIGYRHMIMYIDHLWSREETITLMARDTRRYAKRQFTWFNREPGINWHHPDEKERIINTIDEKLHPKHPS